MKKLLAIFISALMLFTVSLTPVLAVSGNNSISPYAVNMSDETTKTEENDGVLGSHKEEVNLFIKLFDQLYDAFHNFVHFFADLIGFDCPMCDGEDDDTLPDVTTTTKVTTENTTTSVPTTEETTTQKVAQKSAIEKLREDIAKSNGEKVVLTEDIILSSEELVSAAYYNETGMCMLSIENDVTIDLNGHTISYTKENDDDEICEFGIYIKEKANVNFCDSSENKTGKIVVDNKSNNGFLIYAIAHPAATGVTVNIYGGNFVTSNSACIYSQTDNAHIAIYNGKFETTHSDSSVLINVKNGRGSIDIYGGSFKNFVPGVTNASEAVLAEGLAYREEKTDGSSWYKVIEDPYKDYTKFSDAQTVKDAVQNGGNTVATENIVLEGDTITSYSALPFILKEVLFDANGKTITNSTTSNSAFNVLFFTNSNKANLTITGNGTYLLSGNAASATYTHLVYANAGKVTIENGTFDAKGNTSNVAVTSAGSSQIIINGGTFLNNTDSDLIYVSGPGSIIINGGFFKSTGTVAPSHTLNIKSGATGTIKLYGGTYVNYNPAEPEDNGVIIADGYKVVSETQDNGEIWYSVVPESK